MDSIPYKKFTYERIDNIRTRYAAVFFFKLKYYKIYEFVRNCRLGNFSAKETRNRVPELLVRGCVLEHAETQNVSIVYCARANTFLCTLHCLYQPSSKLHHKQNLNEKLNVNGNIYCVNTSAQQTAKH